MRTYDMLEDSSVCVQRTPDLAAIMRTYTVIPQVSLYLLLSSPCAQKQPPDALLTADCDKVLSQGGRALVLERYRLTGSKGIHKAFWVTSAALLATSARVLGKWTVLIGAAMRKRVKLAANFLHPTMLLDALHAGDVCGSLPSRG
jgi:hypothetical protein